MLRSLPVVAWLAVALAACDVPTLTPGDASVPTDAPVRPGELLERGTPHRSVEPRPAFAPIALRGPVRLEARRDGSGGHQRRIVTDAGLVVVEGAAEVFHDATAHPSGAITLALEHTDRAEGGFALRRYRADGTLDGEQPLEVGATLPERDAAGLPTPPWSMRAAWISALEGGWISLAPRGEDVIVLFQSRLADNETRYVAGLSWLRRDASGFVEERTRLVDGPHVVQPAGWNYDELRWIDALMRPLLAVDPTDGTVVVGRAFTQGRCRAAHERFGELDPTTCFERAAGNGESRAIPFFVTTFGPDGERQGSFAFHPARGFYFGTFGMAAHRGEIALAGAVARESAGGGLELYPERPGATPRMVPFDALIARLDHDGTVLAEHRVDRGRAETLLGVRYVGEAGDLIAFGAADWDRHDGGMSVSRGADPLLVHVAPDGTVSHRAFDEDAPLRHAVFYDGVLEGGALRAVGVIDAPMTHSGDHGALDQMTFGALELVLD